ncbi:GPP34 family phosphoprotein [Streptomyces sp. Qhu-G9]|uniref:GOLPH3/VPS74 family protein n=1 Tax=Streptomyces sp. Qhu-G9 TaxID=3452799 RepID=UPI0022AC8DC6|nr:GPP34 family phosphoprotein [Streptomyces aurantiacus]WAU81144.1 GPP34 family phosphoprotein [Streptomyces aurantiacus]
MKTDTTSGLCGDFMLAVYLDEQGRVPGYRTGLGFGLSGAMLMELALGGFIDVLDGRVVAVHGAQPRDRALGEVLVRIRSSRRLRTASEWVRALSIGAHKRLAVGLIAERVLVRTRGRLPLPAWWARRYDVLVGGRRDAVVRSLGVTADSSDRLIALAALASACGVASGGRDWSEYEAMLRSTNPVCAQILTAVADSVWLGTLSSWT